MRTKRKIKTHAKFLAPEHVGSSVRYKIVVSEHKGKDYKDSSKVRWSRDYQAYLYLTDCHEEITISGHGAGGYSHMRKKLVRLLDSLHKMMADMDELQKIYDGYRTSSKKPDPDDF